MDALRRVGQLLLCEERTRRVVAMQAVSSGGAVCARKPSPPQPVKAAQAGTRAAARKAQGSRSLETMQLCAFIPPRQPRCAATRTSRSIAKDHRHGLAVQRADDFLEAV